MTTVPPPNLWTTEAPPVEVAPPAPPKKERAPIAPRAKIPQLPGIQIGDLGQELDVQTFMAELMCDPSYVKPRKGKAR